MGFAEEIEAVGKKMIPLWEEKKFEELAQLCTEDSVGIYSGAGKIEGRAALVKQWAELSKDSPVGTKCPQATSEFACQLTDEIGIQRIAMKVRDVDCWSVLVWKKVDGNWLVKEECFVTKSPVA